MYSSFIATLTAMSAHSHRNFLSISPLRSGFNIIHCVCTVHIKFHSKFTI